MINVIYNKEIDSRPGIEPSQPDKEPDLSKINLIQQPFCHLYARYRLACMLLYMSEQYLLFGFFSFMVMNDVSLSMKYDYDATEFLSCFFPHH